MTGKELQHIIETGTASAANDAITASLYETLDLHLQEKRKQVISEMVNTRVIKEADAKSILLASKRSAAKEKAKKLKPKVPKQ